MNGKDLIQYVAKELVDDPDQVAVNELKGTHATVLELKVAKNDIGKVIGKQGRTANAIRTISKSASSKTARRTSLEIIE